MAAVAAEQHLHVTTAGRRDRNPDPSAVERESIRVYAALPPLIERYPHDAGVLVTLLLNHVVLAAGEAMFIDAGVIHAYTSGFGVEIMASSDNVLRAGLTPKHVDVPELLEITNFTPMPPPLWLPSERRRRRGALPAAGRRVRALRRSARPARPRRRRVPRAVLVLEGTSRCRRPPRRTPSRLAQGEVLFVGACPRAELRLGGDARVAVASVPA